MMPLSEAYDGRPNGTPDGIASTTAPPHGVESIGCSSRPQMSERTGVNPCAMPSFYYAVSDLDILCNARRAQLFPFQLSA
jgi:hypothetical protein